MRLSRNEISTFVGDVFPIKLVDCDGVTGEKIEWSVSSDALLLHNFAEDTRMGFSDGVLVTALKPGLASVECTVDGECLHAEVTVREIAHAESGEEMNYYIGDLHDHTCPINYYDEFAARTSGHAIDYINQVREEGLLDFTAISDHSEPLNAKEFFDNFFVAEEAYPDLVVLPGCECDVTVMDEDRYGIPIKRSGEIVCLNVDDYAECSSWEEFYAAVARKPYPVCILAHPQVVGFSKRGVWDFSLDINSTPEMLHAVRGVEMGDGSLRQSNIINEMVYSLALDNGFKVTTTCSSDSHGPVWGYHRFPGKTVIVAKEKTREAFVDAMHSCRMYGTESGNIKLSYTVNGVHAPATLTPADDYTFRVKVSYFKPDETTVLTECRVISDRGVTVATVKDVDFSDFTFSVHAPEATYFYLRVKDEMSRRTWSYPVWTGRERVTIDTTPITPIDKSGFAVFDSVSGETCNRLVNDQPLEFWSSKHNNADIVIDMGRVEPVSALGHYPRIILRSLLEDSYGGTPPLLAEFPVEYTVSTSLDGETYTLCAEGIFRRYGSEEIVRFAECRARFVRLTVHSNVAIYKGSMELADRGLAIGELTLYT